MMKRLLAISMFILLGFIPTGFCATQVSQYGITWYFDGDYTVGQYFNGDYYVIDPGSGVRINNVSPAPTYSDGRYRNGTQVNPTVGAQGYDNATENWAVGTPFSTTIWNANQYPMTVSAPASVVSTESFTAVNRPAIDAMAVLTVLSEAPPENSFRPPLLGDDKIHYSLDDIQMNLLPNWSPTANTPSAATVASTWAGYYQRPWLLQGSGLAHRHIMPAQNSPSYHRDVAMRLSHGAALMMVNYGDRTDLVRNYLQVCIDYYHALLESLDGPTAPYHYKFQTIFLGLMLNNSTIRDFRINTSNSYTESYHEKKVYFYGDPLNTRNNYDQGETWSIPLGETWTYYNQTTGRAPTFYKTTGDASVNYTEHEHLHPYRWVELVGHCSSSPCRTESYRQFHSVSLVGHILALSALSATEYLNQDALVHYAYRWMHEDEVTLTSNGGFINHPVQTSGATFVDELWDAHADDYRPSNDGSTTTNDGSTTTNDGSTTTNDGSTTTNDDSTTTEDGSTTTDDGSATTDDGSATNDDPLNTGETFRDDFNGTAVDSSVWQVATWVEHGGQTGRERCYVEDGYLNLVFVNDSDEGYLSSAIQTRDTFLYGRWEARLKPSSVSGILNSMYTIDWGDGSGTRQEIDIEFLTRSFAQDSGEVHYAVHAQDRDSFETNPDVALDFNPSDDFHIWGFEITPEHIQWFVDGTILMTYEYSQGDVSIDAPYQLKFNAWTHTQWIGGPPEPDVPCTYQIDWIRFIPYEELPSSGENIPSEPLNYRVVE